jgi:hypothetical protein
MKLRKSIRVLLRVACLCLLIALLFVGIGMLPGNIEGIYRGMGMRCMCNGVAFMQVRNGNVIMFNSAHAPAELYGRYETNSNGSVAFFMSPYQEGQSEKRTLTAYPRLWFTRFETADGPSWDWYWKSPVFGAVKKTIKDQEISSAMIKRDHTVVKTIFNSELKEIRTETIQPRTKTAGQGGRGDGDKPSK